VVVSPIVAKARKEEKVVAKAPVTPPPVEKPAVVTPKVMPAPEVPLIARRSADVEEEQQIWDARKLKPIGIGIAALLAISLSYMGVRAVTKPSAKSRTIVAQPSPTAAPEIVKAKETAWPGLASSPSMPEAAPSGAPQNQGTETAEVTNPLTQPGGTQNVAPPNQDAIGNAAAGQQSTSRMQSGPPQIAAKQPENPSN